MRQMSEKITVAALALLLGVGHAQPTQCLLSYKSLALGATVSVAVGYAAWRLCIKPWYATQKLFWMLEDAGYGHPMESFQSAINAGANLQAKNAVGKTPLMIAADDMWDGLASREYRFGIIKVLVHNGAETDESLEYACRYGKFDVVWLLIMLGADVNFHNGDPLYWALAHENEMMVDFLVKKGCDIQKKRCYENFTEFKMKSYGYGSQKNNDQTPLEYAKDRLKDLKPTEKPERLIEREKWTRIVACLERASASKYFSKTVARIHAMRYKNVVFKF